MKTLFDFPNPVNDYAARLVAAMVVIFSIAFLLTLHNFPSLASWILLLLAYGFLARVATGPTLSPMGLLATKILVPLFKLPEKAVPGPPKRFAQGIGLAFSVASMFAFFVTGSVAVAGYLIATLAFFASLEAFLGFCAGCFIFGWLMRFGWIPASMCKECVIATDD